MKKYTLLITVLFFSTFSFGQKVKIKKGTATVDGQAYLQLENCGALDEGLCSILNLNGEEIISMSLHDDTSRPTRTGFLQYSRIAFLGNNIINEDGILNDEAVNRLVEKYGNEYSKNKVVIINNN